MIITEEIRFDQFEPWSGAVDAFNRICEDGDTDAVESYIEEMYPDGLSDGTLNDWLWFDSEDLYEAAGLVQCPLCEEWFKDEDLDMSDDPCDLEEYCKDCLEEVNTGYYQKCEENDEEYEEEEEEEEEGEEENE
jgi:hypothetical protein